MNFNSIKVRLELADANVIKPYGSTFQFHKGTIRTLKTAETATQSANFNSIKVRLELVLHT